MLRRAKNTPTHSFVSNLYISQHSLPENIESHLVSWKKMTPALERSNKNTCQSHIPIMKSVLLIEAEISVTKVFITAKMKNSNYEVNRK